MITEQCIFCSSINHIEECEDFFVWECWNCLNSHWISDERKEEYVKEKKISPSEADFLLKNNQIKVLYGTT